MTACQPAPKTSTTKPRSRASAHQERPAMPDKQLWKTDKTRAFEIGVQWFLALSRAS